MTFVVPLQVPLKRAQFVPEEVVPVFAGLWKFRCRCYPAEKRHGVVDVTTIEARGNKVREEGGFL